MKITVFKNSVPFWPSLAVIQPQLLKEFRKIYLELKEVDLITDQKANLKDDLWVFLPGSFQIPILNQLKQKRPPALFFLNGEATKLAYHLNRFYHVFRQDDVWSVSCGAEKKLIDDWFPRNNKTVVNHYPVDTELFRPSKKSHRKLFDLPQNKELILYAGRLSLQKNIHHLLSFILKYPEMHLVLCGDFDLLALPHLPFKNNIHLPALILEAIKKNGLGSRVTFIPFQSQENLAKLMQSCDFQISLSAHYGEDFGYSIAQGLCCGLKTILTRWGGHQNWDRSDLKESVGYIPLNWRDHQIGIPLIDELKNLPTKKPLDFEKKYSLEIKQGLKKTTALKNQKPKDSHSAIVKDIFQFWQKSKENKSPTLFTSVKHPLFKQIVKVYCQC